MEIARLNFFYRSLTHWPHSQSEVEALAGRIQALLDVPAVVVWLPGLGLSAAGMSAPADLAIRQEIDRAFAERRTEGNQIKHVQLSKPLQTADGTEVSRLALGPVAGQFFSEHWSPGNPNVPTTAQVEGPNAREHAWVLAFSSKMINGKTELLMAAALQYLSDLAVLTLAESAVGMRDQFLSVASHELKTPLTSIYGILQLQERMARGRGPAPDPEKQRSFLKITIRQVERLNELIDGLLDVSRIQNGRFMVEPSEVDASALLDETVSSRLRVIAEEAGVRMELDRPPNLVAWIDPVRFEEVVTNLGMNAIRFSPEGGVIWVRLRDDGETLRLTVHDQGVSLPEADRARIFLPFERAQHTARLGGMGLGLFISRQIAQLHGGNVLLAESAPGRGNVFEATFPLRRQAIRRQA